MAEFGLENETRPIVVWMARVTAVKGPERVIEIAKAMPDVRFLMVGGGDLFEIMQKRAPENLTLLGWQIPEKIWPIADVALSTSHNEGIPISIIEAQMAGVPVIAASAGAISEIVVDGKTGFVTSNEVTQLVFWIRRILDSNELKERLSLGSQQSFIEKFHIDRFVIEYLRIYANVRQLIP